MAQSIDTQDYLDDFLVEAGEHLSALDDTFLSAEALTRSGAPLDGELVNSLFRSIHTLKGMAGMMGFAMTSAIAHEIEHIFDEVRQEKRRLQLSDWAALFGGLDALKGLQAQIKKTGQEAGIDVSPASQALAALTATPPSSQIDYLALVDPHEQMAVLVEVAKGSHLFVLAVAPLKLSDDLSFEEWLGGLGLIGRVLGIWNPEGQALSALDAFEHPLVNVLIVTEADRESVLDCSGVPAAALSNARLPWAPGAEAAPVASEQVLEARHLQTASVPARPGPGPEPDEKLQSIRVETSRVDHLLELVGELLIHHTRLAKLSADLLTRCETDSSELTPLAWALHEALQSTSRVSAELQESTMKIRMTPIGTLFNRFPRIVRDLARDCGKRARLEVMGTSTELDKAVIEQIGDPLIHLLRNALDHGLEPPEERQAKGKAPEGTILLDAAQQGDHIILTISDDGRGIDKARVLAKALEKGLIREADELSEQEIYQLIFKPGFSTAPEVTAISGRGVGMDVVQRNIQKLGGRIQVHSEPGIGTRFVITLPLTLAIARALLVRVADQTFAVPLSAVEETVNLRPFDIQTVREKEVFKARERVVPLFHLRSLFSLTPEPRSARAKPVVLLGQGEQQMGLMVDELLGQQDVVVKPLGAFLGQVPGIGGATILGDGLVALILDVTTLLSRHRA